jgi:hypothetical protein
MKSEPMDEEQKPKRRRGQSPTSRTLQYCAKKLGWPVGVVERRLPHTFTTVDLFGCIDVMAIAGDRIMGIQATTGAHHANRLAKSMAEPRLRAWLAAGALFEVWSWTLAGAAGKQKRWTLRREALELKMLPQAVPAPLASQTSIDDAIRQSHVNTLRAAGGE